MDGKYFVERERCGENEVYAWENVAEKMCGKEKIGNRRYVEMNERVKM